MQIRPLSPETDYPTILALFNTYFSDPLDRPTLQAWYERAVPGRILRTRVATGADGTLTGYSEVIHESWALEGHFYTWVIVDPHARGGGIGSALFAEAQAYWRTQPVAVLESEVRDNDPQALRFAEQRGFRIDRHRFESILDLEAFDETPFLPTYRAVIASGIRIFSLAELPDSQAGRRKLYEVNRTTALDRPGAEDDFSPFEEFEKIVFESAWYRAGGQWVAADGDRWIGLAAVKLIPETQGAYNLMTGVLQPYRGRKIAQALKLAAIRYARQNGARYLRTNNDACNAPMLAINRKLGYQSLPGQYRLRCTNP